MMAGAMNVFIYEYTCGAGAEDAGADALRREGLAMLTAVLEDFTRLPGVRPVALVHECCARLLRPELARRLLAGTEAEPFRALAREADYALVIAPESGGRLETRCRWALEAGAQLLGPSPRAVRLAGDKLVLADRLRRCSVPTPPVFGRPDRVRAGDFPLVVKPRHGAGSQATWLVPRPCELPGCLARARQNEPADELLVQPFIPGRPASVSLLLGPRARLCLPPVAQHLSREGRFRYQGGSLPLPPDLASRAADLACRAAAAVPGLRGYVGVDLVLGPAADGRGDAVIEINPRLTTSYVGLRTATPDNLAEAMLRAVRGEALPALRWRAGGVWFRADGRRRARAGPAGGAHYQPLR
jgi:predicted ATP-grasp superfamily ATP-dependent carboligase